MGLREDIAEVNRLAKACDEKGLSYISYVERNTDFTSKAMKLFRESGDSIELFIDMALTVKPTPEEHDQEDE